MSSYQQSSEGDVLGDKSAKMSDPAVLRCCKVKDFEPKLKNSSLCVVDDLIVNTSLDLYKVIKKIRPDSPDVIRAAKRFEQARLNGKCTCEQILETTEEYSHKGDASDKILGAKRKNER